MKNTIKLSFQIAAVFVGTIVGAGLASGQEIKQFFTVYGYKSFIGIMLCCLLYIILTNMIINISIRYNLKSYSDLIDLVSLQLINNVFGMALSKTINILISVFLVCGSAIILAGSGALLSQFSGLPKLLGVFLMALIVLITLLRNTKGLIEINSVIVPCLIIIIITIFLLNLFFYKNIITLSYLKALPVYKSNYLFSTLLYVGYNVFGSTGVLVPLSSELKNKKALRIGVTIGSLVLTVLCLIINLLLLLNIPYIFHYEIPLLYIAHRFGKTIQIVLLLIIWLEMFSTAVSDIFSVGKSLEHSFNLSYNKSIIIVLIIALPISQIGFVNLISTLYPLFGMISVIFIVGLTIFYFKKTKVKK